MFLTPVPILLMPDSAGRSIVTTLHLVNLADEYRYAVQRSAVTALLENIPNVAILLQIHRTQTIP